VANVMRFSFSTIFTLSLLAALPRLAHAAIVWKATHEAGDLKEWTGGTNPTKTLPDNTVRKNVEVLGEQVYGGKLACKITVHPDDTFGQYNQDRVDLSHASTITGEGKDSYVSGYYYLPEDAKTRNEIFFYETNVSYRNWMDLWIEPKQGGGTTVKFGIESQGATLGSVLLWTGDWTPAAWHQLAIHVHWSTNSNQGVVDLWFDGKQVLTAVKHNTKFDDNVMFLNAGMHRVLPQNFTEVLYMDEFTEADSLADINVGAPTTAGGTGGTAGASMGGAGGTAQTEAGTGGTGQAGASAGAATAGGGADGIIGAPNTGGGGSSGAATTPSAGMSNAAGNTVATNNGNPGQSNGSCQCALSGPRSERGKTSVAGAALAIFGLLRRRRAGARARRR
jgi:hypothetical protein